MSTAVVSENPGVMAQLLDSVAIFGSELLAIEATGLLNDRREEAGVPPGQVDSADQTPPLTDNTGQNLTGMDQPKPEPALPKWVVQVGIALIVLIVIAFAMGWV